MKEAEFDGCIQRIRQGDKGGLKEIYGAYVGLVYSIMYEMTRQREDAQDLTSEFFIRLWEKADSYRMGGKHKGWIAAIARNMAVDFLRKRGRELAVEDAAWSQAEGAGGFMGSVDGFAEELVGDMAMQEALALLKPAQRQVLDLKILGEMTFQEIADTLGKPLGTVSWLYRQGIQRLREAYRVKKEVRE